MKKIYTLLTVGFSLLSANVFAQKYTSQVSKDSLTTLNYRLDALKASQKLYELKIKEADEEAEVEKLRVKLTDANAKAEQAAKKNTSVAELLKDGKTEHKNVAKAAKAAQSEMAAAAKALEKYNKQIKRVEDLRAQIQSEEQKITQKSSQVVFK
ncbi:hypothetical protein [Pedobacter montanisoli]|uniref:Uncharacterized protein n=1 Tax=Pedobacter montanisoli TaxID=2923277 RepID=A0ABS9ZV73_9SPHI|nr:hypothetical protein [Pedobacter montanisoli]MCJ0742104.1 hypothetical protein [Pedobacter montanisoli]